jgi:peptide chain release factor 1
MLNKLTAIYERYVHLEELLSDPTTLSDQARFTKINKEYKDLKPLAEAYHAYTSLVSNIASAREMLSDTDPDMRSMAREELSDLEPQKKELDEKVKYLLIPKDPDDSKDVIFEIRSGTGGDEASIFAGDLYRMYTRYFDTLRWKYDIIFINEGAAGGYNKVVLEIFGEDVYGKLKFESGAHRVQRVPETEAKGRVHTSAATVVVMPKYEEEEININKADLRVDTFRASGAGGQHVNKTESGIRITHLPTGVVAESTESRSQHQNREIAMQRMYMEIKDNQRKALESTAAEQRKSLVGSGDRSEKIRTYNFPQNRLTDHRINLTTYNLDKVIEGDISDTIEALRVAENANKLQEGQE